MGTVLSELTETASLVIIDAPPLLPVADAQILLDRPEIDSCLVVARAYFTKRDQARRTRTLLEQHRVTPLGVVVTGLRDMHTYEYYGSSSSRGELLSPGENGSRADRRRLRREAKSQ
jgi:Mrp family chromosome partitioning ATPase